MLLDAGAEWSFSTTSPPVGEITALDRQNPLGLAPASRHVMGTCRMGDDPTTSVVNRESRFHDVENMLCADSSVFVTSAGYGPTLTLAALSLRAAALLTGTPLPATRPPNRLTIHGSPRRRGLPSDHANVCRQTASWLEAKTWRQDRPAAVSDGSPSPP